MRICISVGHSILKNGYITSADGTKHGGGNEYQFCKEFAPILKKYLVEAGHKVDIIRVPERSVTSQSEERKYKLARYNAKKYDLNIELHLNASDNGEAKGTEALYISNAGKEYAEAISKALAELYKNRGTKKRTDLYFLNNTKAKAVLLELFFCTNHKEWKKAQTNKRKMARLITEAIASVE